MPLIRTGHKPGDWRQEPGNRPDPDTSPETKAAIDRVRRDVFAKRRVQPVALGGRPRRSTDDDLTAGWLREEL